jgi:phosphopantothenate---cysteine ligase (CTP)
MPIPGRGSGKKTCALHGPIQAGRVHCVVTAGPTFEPLDQVRRLTNLSTGKLGARLAAALAARGHRVTLLRGTGATFREEAGTAAIETFSTTEDLRRQFEALSGRDVGAVFHAAAVSDFKFGRVFQRDDEGNLKPVSSGKFSTRQGTLLGELTPTPKIISLLRGWFPGAILAGWKYEVEGNRAQVLEQAARQMADYRTDACVANGPAYGFGFGLARRDGTAAHFSDTNELYAALEKLLR